MKNKSVLVIGAGTWGQKIIHTLTNGVGVQNLFVVHRNKTEHRALSAKFPQIRVFEKLTDLDPSVQIDLAVVATQVSAQFDILSQLAERKMTTLVEKPFCSSLDEARTIYGLFKSPGTKLFVNNIYLHSANFKRFKILFKKYFFGSSYAFSSRRWDFGSFPKDSNTLHHLLYHDLVILDDLIGLQDLYPNLYNSLGTLQSQLILKDANGAFFDLSASQISAEKVRLISVANADYNLCWNDLDATDPIQLTKYNVDEKSKTKLEISETTAAKGNHTALFNSIKYALDSAPALDYESVEAAIKTKAFIQEIENGTKILHNYTRL